MKILLNEKEYSDLLNAMKQIGYQKVEEDFYVKDSLRAIRFEKFSLDKNDTPFVVMTSCHDKNKFIEIDYQIVENKDEQFSELKIYYNGKLKETKVLNVFEEYLIDSIKMSPANKSIPLRSITFTTLLKSIPK